MRNNKVDKTARIIWKIFYALKNGATTEDQLSSFEPLIENIIEIARVNTRGWKEMALRLNEYLADVSDCIRTQWRGCKCEVGMIFKSEIIQDANEDPCIVQIRWGLIDVDESIYTINCKEKTC